MCQCRTVQELKTRRRGCKKRRVAVPVPEPLQIKLVACGCVAALHTLQEHVCHHVWVKRFPWHTLLQIGSVVS